MGLNDHASAGRIIVMSAVPAAWLEFLSWHEDLYKVEAFPPDYKQPNGMGGRKNPDSSQ